MLPLLYGDDEARKELDHKRAWRKRRGEHVRDALWLQDSEGQAARLLFLSSTASNILSTSFDALICNAEGVTRLPRTWAVLHFVNIGA